MLPDPGKCAIDAQDWFEEVCKLGFEEHIQIQTNERIPLWGERMIYKNESMIIKYYI